VREDVLLFVSRYVRARSRLTAIKKQSRGPHVFQADVKHRPNEKKKEVSAKRDAENFERSSAPVVLREGPLAEVN
jgi:hypothetical protein